MLSAGSFELLHLVGFLTGTVLYGMLLWMVTRGTPRADAFAVSTGVLGVVWNVGELAAYSLRLSGHEPAVGWIHAFSFTALGLLASVVVHSVARVPAGAGAGGRSIGTAVAVVVYACAAWAGLLQFTAALAGDPLPSPGGLTTITIGLLLVIPALIAVTRRQPNGTRALWMAALAVVAVSSLHLGRFHGAQQSWPMELVGHHASLVLAFAILYQDYRFALADLFLKQALTLLTLVAIVSGGFSLVAPLLETTNGSLSPVAIALLLTLWAGTALLFPFCRRLVARFVDRVVLGRADYSALLWRLTDEVEQCDSVPNVLAHGCRTIAAALTATSVTWTEEPQAREAASVREVQVLTAETPYYVLSIGLLAGGRRLLSDDLAMLERVSRLLARRIDAVRLIGERYDRMLQEREMRTLTTEAELRALRAQINPHFLFNALTTVGYLIEHAPSRALKTLLNLTTLLRSVLRSEGEFTTLGRERELLECYLRIERERFEERLEFTVDIADDLSRCVVPSLIVQPLVENAVKHGIAPAREGGVVIVNAGWADNGGLRITVQNTGAPLGGARTSGPGVGLENVTRRLRHYYGDAASLAVAAHLEGGTRAELRLPVTSERSLSPAAGAAAGRVAR